MQHTDGSRPLSFITESIRERAQRLADAGHHAAAAIEYQVLIDIDPTDVQAGLELAHHLVQEGRRERAADEYLRLAGVYARLGHDRRAMKVALEALRLEPGRMVVQRLAPLVARLGATASELCEQVARLHMLADRRDDARDVLRLLVHSDPSALSRRQQLAELELAEGRTPEAMDELRIVADALRSQGRTEELLRVLEMMHAHGGPDETVLRELATIYVRCGQPRRALAKLEALHAIAPRDRVALERLARVHASMGRLQLTIRLLDRLVDLIDEQADRGELRAMLRRAASWSTEVSYQHALEDLGLRALRGIGMRPVEVRPGRGIPALRSARRRPGVPPPLPRWIPRPARATSSAGEIHVLDLDTDAAELISDDAVLLPDGIVALVS